MKTCIVAIEYIEPEYKKTLDSIALLKDKYQVIKADRKGLYGIPEAFNKAFKQVPDDCKYVWFITNITFDPYVIEALESAMDKTGYAAMVPVYDSDHHTHRPKSFKFGDEIQEIPFVEFTCPMVRADVFRQVPLHNELPYDYHDLAWGEDVRRLGHKLGVLNCAEVGHVYLRNSGSRHPISIKRARLRRNAEQSSKKFMFRKYGPNWEKLTHWK